MNRESKMEFSFKKTALAAIAAVGLSGGANAAMYEPACVHPNVELPCKEVGWAFGAAYLLVQPTADGVQYAQSFPVPEPRWQDEHRAYPNPITGRVHDLSPGFNSSGLKLDASYFFGYGEDITVEWWRIFRRNTGRDIDGLEGIIPPYGLVPEPSSLSGVHADGSLSNDEVNIEWGQKVLYGERWLVRKHFGVSYARVEATLKTRTQKRPFNRANFDPDTALGFYNISDERSRFNGFGPRLGADTYYDLHWGGLSLVGHGAAALYVGELELDSAIRDNLMNEGPGPSTKTFSSRTVVPALKGQLGVNYAYVTQYNSVLNAEISYIWAGYFNTIRSPMVVASETQIASVLVQQPRVNSAGDVTNFGYHGLVFELKWRSYV